MYSIIVILILIACVLLIGVVLIQNPKGGGLGQSFGGFSNQVMGVQRTTDFLEKATWTLVGTVAGLALFTVFFVDKPQASATPTGPKSQFEGVEMTTPAAAPPPTAPQNQTKPTGANPLSADSSKK